MKQNLVTEAKHTSPTRKTPTHCQMPNGPNTWSIATTPKVTLPNVGGTTADAANGSTPFATPSPLNPKPPTRPARPPPTLPEAPAAPGPGRPTRRNPGSPTRRPHL